MRKIVINSCYGGFGISEFAKQELEKRNVKFNTWASQRELRESPHLIFLLEEYGADKISGKYVDLKIIEIPDIEDLPEYEIDDYDGMEQILDPKRIWR